MKFSRVLIVVVVVSVIHALLWIMLWPRSSGSEMVEPAAGAGSAVEQVTAAGSVAVAPQGNVTAEQPGAAAAGQGVQAGPAVRENALPVPSQYGEFLEDPGDLPAKLRAKIDAGCRSGILVDLGSRRILWQKDAETSYAIASMSKIMTAYELMAELREAGSKNTLETKVQVPKKMFRKFNDCHIYMDPRESFTLEELLKCMMIHSANDCAYLIGDYMAGSEEAFVAKMNARAKALGFQSFSFCNTNGLPDRQNKRANRGSALELAHLAECVMDIPEIMKWAGTHLDAIRENTKPFHLANKNKLLGSARCPGVNGLKTGYINESKSCITVTCERDGRRLVCVIMGADSAMNRDALVIELLNWGYSVGN